MSQDNTYRLAEGKVWCANLSEALASPWRISVLPEDTDSAIAVLDGTGSLVVANRLFVQLAGYAREEIAGMQLGSLFPGDQRAIVLCATGPQRVEWRG